MIQSDDTLIGAQVLSDAGFHSQTDRDSCNEQKRTTHNTHKQLLYLPERCEVSLSFSQTQSSSSSSNRACVHRISRVSRIMSYPPTALGSISPVETHRVKNIV